MRFGLLQMVLGLSLIGLAGLRGGALWLLAWPGASVFVVGVAYVLERPEVFGKSPETGRLAWLPQLLIAPYFLVAWALWQLKSRLTREPAFDEVAPGVLVGRRPLHRREAPPDLAVVVDLTSEFRRSPHLGGRYVAHPTLDTRPPVDLAALTERLVDEPGTILFHCAMGHGRSATAAAALLLRRGLDADVDAAVDRMRAARPGVHLHADQRFAVQSLNAKGER